MTYLTYCLNVHPGESWAENMLALRTKAKAVRELVAPGRRWGPGLRLSARAAAELDLEVLKRFLAEEGMEVYTMNGFPYGRFHGGPVKEQVYAPDWRTAERRDYTVRLVRILGELVPEGAVGSISTVPGTWKGWMRPGGDEAAAMIGNLAACAAECARVEEAKGREMVVALEPEPGCMLERTEEAVDFFARLHGEGGRALARQTGWGESRAEELMRRHTGVCLDTCHAAVEFEEPLAALRRLEQGGIRVPKVQLSAALRTTGDGGALAALGGFVEPVYLHQTRAVADGRMERWNDLGPALDDLRGRKIEEVRVHFHVPLHWKGEGVLGSTAGLITPEFLRYAAEDGRRHFEIETYTWDVLPGGVKEGRIEESIAREIEWTLARPR